MINPLRILKSFRYALKGLHYAFMEEQNFRFHVLSAVVVLVLMFLLDTSAGEKVILIILIATVIIAELTNSIFERIVDILKPRLHPYAKKIKDMTAAIVFIAAITSFICGLIIFLPKILVLKF